MKNIWYTIKRKVFNIIIAINCMYIMYKKLNKKRYFVIKFKSSEFKICPSSLFNRSLMNHYY